MDKSPVSLTYLLSGALLRTTQAHAIKAPCVSLLFMLCLVVLVQFRTVLL